MYNLYTVEKCMMGGYSDESLCQPIKYILQSNNYSQQVEYSQI